MTTSTVLEKMHTYDTTKIKWRRIFTILPLLFIFTILETNPKIIRIRIL